MRLFLSALLLGIATHQESIKFSVSLKETSSVPYTSNFILLTSSFELLDGVCDYKVTVLNYAPSNFKVLQNGEECPSGGCSDSLARYHTANITIQKSGYHLNILTFECSDFPRVSVMGCESGLLSYENCTKITESGPDSFCDEVCICTTSHPYCYPETEMGTCSSGKPTWWQADDVTTSTQLITTTSTSPDPSPLPTLIYEQFAVNLTETATYGIESHYVKVQGTMNCSAVLCNYRTTVQQDKLFYTVFVDGKDCSVSICNGTFWKGGTSVPVIVRRGGQHLDLFNFQYKDKPNVVVLGCENGLFLNETCTQVMSYSDSTEQVCSCRGEPNECKTSFQTGSCVGGDITWWMDDPSTSTSTTPAPAQDLYVFDVSFVLSEGPINEQNAQSGHNVTIYAFMNCTTTSCLYTVSYDPSPSYVTIMVGNEECPESQCSATLSKGQAVGVKASRTNEILDVFDLQFIESPNVAVLGCSSGLMSYEQCQVTSHFDTTLQMDDTLCVCRSTDHHCDKDTVTGECGVGEPVWWKPQPEPTTAPYTLAFNISLTEVNPSGDKVLSANVYLECSDENCTYRIGFKNNSLGYFTVLVSGGTCSEPSCGEGSFPSNKQVSVTVKRKGELLHWFELGFQNSVILGCSSGYLVTDKCSKIESTANGVKDVVCSCENDSNECESGIDATCLEGSPVWWKTDPDATTTVTPYIPTTSPSIMMKAFTVLLSESKSDKENKQYNVTVAATFNCTQISCNYEAEFVTDDPNYFTVLVNKEVCSSPCRGTIRKGGPDVVLTVHRTEQHIELIVFGFETEPKVLVAGCGGITKSSDLQLLAGVNDGVCLYIPHTLNDQGSHLTDDLCVCQGLGASCDKLPDLGKCTQGQLEWWVDDPGRTTSTPQPTTTVDTRNHFLFEISLAETKKSSRESERLEVISSLKCTPEDCSYEISVQKGAINYFSVFAGDQDCNSSSCLGSFKKGSSVNVTVYRGDQQLDLFDFQYTDIPRVVVLGCEDGMVEYGNCLKTSHSETMDNEVYADELCSCRSHQLECSSSNKGVCRSGTEKWWRDVATSSAPTTTPTLTSIAPDYILPLKNLSDSTIGLNNVTQILNETLNYSNDGTNLNGTQIFEISKILHNAANLAGISADNAIQILTNMDACLNADEKELRKGHSKEYGLLGVLQPMVHNTVDKSIRFLQGKNMGFGAKHVDCSNIDSDDGLIDYGPDVGFALLNDTNRLSATQHNSIIVPLQDVCSGGEEVTHVFFTIYRHQKLFVGQQRYRVYRGEQSDPGSEGTEDSRQGFRTERETNENDTSVPYPPPSKCADQISVPDQSVVLSATILNDGVEVSRLSSDSETPIVAKLQFNVGKMLQPLHGKLIVSWFDQGALSWQTEEQCTVVEIKDGIVTATCKHLTDFSALIYGQLNAQMVCNYALILIGYVVNAVSIACLVFLITISCMFYINAARVSRLLIFIRGQIQTQGDIVNLTYYSIFLLFFVLLIGFMDQSEREADLGTTSTYCIVIAALSYFSLISAIMMSMLIGIRMVCHFFPPNLRKFFVVMTSPATALSIGLVIPFTLTLLLAIFDTSFFERDDGFCWVRPDFVVYAVIVPITIPIINGILCSTFAIYKMFFQAKRSLSNKETSHHDAEFWSKVIGLLIMQVAMGLPWGIEFIIIGISGASPWDYIFVILLGTQGIDLFLIFLYRRQRLVRESKKWSAREQRLAGNSKGNAFMD